MTSVIGESMEWHERRPEFHRSHAWWGMMPEAVEAIEQLVLDLTDVWNSHDVDRIVEFYAPDYEGIDVGDAAPQRGPEGVYRTVTRYFAAFPDLHFTIDETIGQGNRVAFAWTARGTHQGTLMGIPATGRTIEVRGASLLTISGGKVARALYIWDVAGVLRAIRLLPEL